MGRDLYEASPAARAIYDQADEVLGIPLSRLCFEGPASRLSATDTTQPAIMATSVALLAALAEANTAKLLSFVSQRAIFVAGHSLGEYTALVAAGAVDLLTALRLVHRRGQLMAAATRGTMAAIIGMDEEPLARLCSRISTEAAPVTIANYNSPGQLVISGAVTAVEEVMILAQEEGAKHALPLNINGAFHSPLMNEAARSLSTALMDAPLANAAVEVISNVTAMPVWTAGMIRQELVAQMTAPVRWTDSINYMALAGVSSFVEIGPGKVLTGLIRRIAPQSRLITLSTIADVYGFSDALDADVPPRGMMARGEAQPLLVSCQGA
jgi:[acyl-carrier-protein] S-malonyltransferase